jgi:hypothetical protein
VFSTYPQIQLCGVRVAVIAVIYVSVVPGYCTGRCGYRYWYLFVLSREQELQNYGIFQKHGASGKLLLGETGSHGGEYEDDLSSGMLTDFF